MKPRRLISIYRVCACVFNVGLSPCVAIFTRAHAHFKRVRSVSQVRVN